MLLRQRFKVFLAFVLSISFKISLLISLNRQKILKIIPIDANERIYIHNSAF